MSSDVGVKDDSGKLPYHLIAPEVLESLAKVLEFGANKYAPRNWEKGMSWSRVFSALMRHMWAWFKGGSTDPETGFSHLEHAACCIMFLVAYEQRKVGIDDRPVSEGPSFEFFCEEGEDDGVTPEGIAKVRQRAEPHLAGRVLRPICGPQKSLGLYPGKVILVPKR